MVKRPGRGLIVAVAALLAASAMSFACHETLCRYLTPIEGTITFTPTAKPTPLTGGFNENGIVALTGEGQAHLYLHIGTDAAIPAVTVDGEIAGYEILDVLPQSTVHRKYGDGKLCRLINEDKTPMIITAERTVKIIGENILNMKLILESVDAKGGSL